MLCDGVKLTAYQFSMGGSFNIFEGSVPMVRAAGESAWQCGDTMAVLQFPADRRVGDIKRCAKTLHRLHGEAANLFWRSEMVEFAATLRRQGVGEEEISRQAGLFMHAVQMELQTAFAIDEINASA